MFSNECWNNPWNYYGSGQSLTVTSYSGRLLISNFSGSTDYIGIGLEQGQIILDSTTVTSGTVIISGVGDLVDENGN